MPSYLLEAFLLGLSTGTVCLAYCAPVLVPLVMAEEGFRLPRLFLRLGLFLLGRLGGYLTIGLLVGLFSQAVATFSHSWINGLVTLLMALALIVFGVLKNFPTLKWCQVFPLPGSSSAWVFILGLLTGLNLCPPFLAAITASATLPTLFAPLFYFAAFFAGTAVYVPPLVILGPLANRESVSTVAKISLLLSGLWFLVKGILMML